jgi:hypothetical protein
MFSKMSDEDLYKFLMGFGRRQLISLVHTYAIDLVEMDRRHKRLRRRHKK